MKFDIVANMVDPVGNKVQVPLFVDLRISMFLAKILSPHKDASTGGCVLVADSQTGR